MSTQKSGMRTYFSPPCREGLGVGLLVDFIVYSRGSLNVVDELVLHIY